ncbi:MAG: DUF2064 domain-containing protein [Leptospiraceae bacterium]|nr:DUF2064 domain-containing protein [Leptospiraceae bacterium]
MKQIFFVKPPVPGQAKTRLSNFLGEKAIQVYKVLLESVIHSFEGDVLLSLSEPDSTGYFAQEYPTLPQSIQKPGHLGLRMAEAFLEARRDWPEHSILLTGGDVPEYTPAMAQRAANALEQFDVVLIPAGDGGYSTVGLSHNLQADDATIRSSFEGMDWSTDRVLAQQQERFRTLGWTVATLEPVEDLDDAADLYRLMRRPLPGSVRDQLSRILPSIAVILPVLNEAENLKFVLEPLIESGLFSHIVCADNGSDDGSQELASSLGVEVTHCQRKGYGSTCLVAMEYLSGFSDWDVLLFTDADGSDDPADLFKVLGPVVSGRADLCIGRRQGGLLLHQRFGNWLATFLIRLLYRHRYSDLGPFRAIGRAALSRLRMDDPDFGWTVQMQIRALRAGLRVQEADVTSRKRHAGRSKVSATVRGSVMAGWVILRTVGKEFLLNKNLSRR